MSAWLFAFFLVSGFCSLVYQVVWLRLSMAAFGVTAPLTSLVISVFMAGLALGSWLGGRFIGRVTGWTATGALRLYALAELVVAASGSLVPAGLAWGRGVICGPEAGATWGSLEHYLVAGACVSIVLLPFCVAMGTTFPLGMAVIRNRRPAASSRSFSYLYLANVIGACAGTLVSALVLVETLGFRRTLLVAASLNGLLAAAALTLSLVARAPAPTTEPLANSTPPPVVLPRRSVLLALFATGFSSMGMEVVWTRQFTPYLGTLVYTFALILAAYLAATFAGSALYRLRTTAGAATSWSVRWIALGVVGLLPLAAADPRWTTGGEVVAGIVRLMLGIGPLCAALGYFTPMLLDQWSQGDPDRAGGAYALNMLGCIVGPLVSGFVLLPAVGERAALALLALPLCAVGLLTPLGIGRRGMRPILLSGAVGAALLVLTADYETLIPRREVRRDYTATVIATGEGMRKQLLVNGVSMTILTPITKTMAHLPLAHLERAPTRGLALGLGMGVTFRSLSSWGIDTTAVELVPSVPELFGYYFPGDTGLLHSPRSRVVVDDARRYLERTTATFDVITIDPPPPPQAAASSLLYSREFYQSARRRLSPAGMLQQWHPEGDAATMTSVTRALVEVFPHVRAFASLEGWGVHFLASLRPIASPSPAAAGQRLPEAAARDFLEWGPGRTAEEQFAMVLSRELPLAVLLRLDPDAPTLSDDRPVNEYYLLRHLRSGRRSITGNTR